MLNVELKVRDPDPAATRRACAQLGARPAGVLRQRDTYFGVPTGRLKLREDLEGDGAELIRYRRPDVEGLRASSFTRVRVVEREGLREALADALGVAGIVEKTRRLFLHEHVRIHLDEVVGLGSFVELEGGYGEAEEAPTADELLDRTIAALGLDRRDPIAGSYVDLLASSRS